LKAEGRALDKSDCLIEDLIDIQSKEASPYNEIIEICSSEGVLKMTEVVNLNSAVSTYCNGHEVDYITDRETNVAFPDASYSTPHDTQIDSGPLDVRSCQARDTSPNEPQPSCLLNTFHALKGNEQTSPSAGSADAVTQISLEETSPSAGSTDAVTQISLEETSPSAGSADAVTQISLEETSPSAGSADAVTQISLEETSPSRESADAVTQMGLEPPRSIPSVPTHTRSFSQTTSQLTNLKGSINCDNTGDTSVVNGSSLLRSNVKELDVPQITSSDEDEMLALQDVTNSTGHDAAAYNPDDVKEKSALGCSSNLSLCPGPVSYLTNLECDMESHLTDSLYPDWKLDRRGSGHLYWRRDSSTLNGVDATSRVKFRYHIEVREFESRSSETEDLSEEDDDDDDDDSDAEVEEIDKYSVPDSFGSAVVIGGAAVIAGIVMASCQWLLSSLSVT
jgi:hypothetical protein